MTKETKSDIEPLVVTAKQVRKMLCVSDSTIRVLVCTKGFPRPLDLGIYRTLWRLSDIEEWLKNCKFNKDWR